MTTRHEKNVQRKQRVKARNNAIAETLRSKPLRPINTCDLQTLKRALGLPLDLSLMLGEEAQEDNFGAESLHDGADSKSTLTNLSNIWFTNNASEAVSQPIAPDSKNFGCRDLKFVDAIFIAIDFEHSHYSPKTGRIRLREVGISMFDTRDLRNQNNQAENIISTQHYRTVSDTKEFVFGMSIDTSQEELVLILKRLLYLEDKPPDQIRKLILVGHGFNFEIKVLKGLGIDLTLASSIIEVFDTEFLGYEVFGRSFKSSLSNVVRKTGFSGRSFHNAGNDASYSLRAMLLLAIHGYDDCKLEKNLRPMLKLYRKVAQFQTAKTFLSILDLLFSIPIKVTLKPKFRGFSPLLSRHPR